MKKSILFLAATVFTLTACTKTPELTEDQAKETIENVYKFRAEDNKDGLATVIEGALPEQITGIEADILDAVKVYGPVQKYELATITPLVYADQHIYEAVYNVQFEKGQGTETFKVKNVANQGGAIVGYAAQISASATEATETTQEVAPVQDSIK